MMKLEQTLQNQVRNLNAFIQGIENLRGPIILGGVPFLLKDLKSLANDMQLNVTYVVLDVESLRRENAYLKGMDNG